MTYLWATGLILEKQVRMVPINSGGGEVVQMTYHRLDRDTSDFLIW